VNDSRIGVMTGVNPYQVQIDGESLPLNLAPVVLSTVNVGDYVWCQFFGQQLVVFGRIQDGSIPQLGSTEDLDAFVYTGQWGQPLSANTSLAHNYPATTAGLLEVFRSHPQGSMVHQRYSVYGGNQVWWRTYYNGTWNPWVLIGSGIKANVTVASGWTVRSGYGFTVTQLGNHLAVVNGALQNTSGATQTTSTVTNAGGFPSWACPPTGSTQVVMLGGNSIVASSSANQPTLEIHSDGSSTAFGLSLAANGFVSVVGTYNTI
jgi:hypothetical protein